MEKPDNDLNNALQLPGLRLREDGIEELSCYNELEIAKVAQEDPKKKIKARHSKLQTPPDPSKAES